MTAGLPIRPTPAACRISAASPILHHPSLITVSGDTNTGEPWERFSVSQSIKAARNGSGTNHLVFIAGHPSRYWPPHWRLTSQPCLCSYNHSTWTHSPDQLPAYSLEYSCFVLYSLAQYHIHGGPSEAGDCSHPPPKMATRKTRLHVRPLLTML